jgi:hypothetical protein
VIKTRGPLVGMLVEVDQEKHVPFIINESSTKVLYVVMLKALYGMLQSSLLYYKTFCKDIEQIGFQVNPHDPCVAN